MHIQKRGNTWFAYMNVPADIQHVIGKKRFFQTTQTTNKKLAEQRASVLVQGWKLIVQEARGNAPDPFIAEALVLAGLMKSSDPLLVRDVVVDDVLPRIRSEYGHDSATEFDQITTGKTTALAPLLPAFRVHEEKRGLAAKTIDQMLKDVGDMVAVLRTTANLTPKLATAWINVVAHEHELSASSVNRMVGNCRTFFKYLQSIGEILESIEIPFTVPNAYRKTKKKNAKTMNKVESWIPFEIEHVEALHDAAATDDQLQALIKLGAYTGARIEELCALKISDVFVKQGFMNITDAKTEAGVRSVPIHSKLVGLVEELLENSTDGFLISGLTFNKYGNRSNAVGKRFGRLKKRQGFGDRHVFHSIRKTVCTMLERARIPEGIAADIVGHDKPSLTYGLYSGGASITEKRDAIEILQFAF